jgi:hypothetical protein
MANPFHLASAYAALSIPFGSGTPKPVSLDFGVHPAVAVNTQRYNLPMSGMATPIGYFYDSNNFDRQAHREEMMHIDQWEALGPTFLPAYLATVGEPFEPYRTRGSDIGVRLLPSGELDPETHDLDRMWMPPPEMERQFPQFRVTFNRDGETPHRAEFLPGYRDGFEAIMKMLRDIEEATQRVRQR